MRRFGESPKTDVSYVRRPGVYGVLCRGHNVLLTFQDSPIPEFQLPGGGVDKGESPIQALHREVMEETGWRISNAKLIGKFRRFVFMPDYNMHADKICFVFAAMPTVEISDPLEIGHTSHWVSHDAAVDLIANPGDKFFLKKMRAQKSW